MRTRHYIATGLATLAITTLLFARAAHIPLPEKRKASDIIPVVEITATKPAGAAKPHAEVATAKIIEIVKGRIDGATFSLDYENDLVCPNVGYVRGERCLIFATKLPTGHFATYNTYNGKFTVTNDTVIGWEGETDMKLEAVREEIRKHVR